MQGNVYTWCQEMHKSYPEGKEGQIYGDIEDMLSINTSNRVARGGSLIMSASNLRSAMRNQNGPTTRDYTFGFRPARTLPLVRFFF